jgi:mRNA interferase MazF
VGFERWDVVVVPFPFTDKARTRRRPALVLSDAGTLGAIDHATMAMITSARNPPWPLDVAVADLDSAGLPAPSVVRMKLFTLDLRFVHEGIGALAKADRKAVATSLVALLPIAPRNE